MPVQSALQSLISLLLINKFYSRHKYSILVKSVKERLAFPDDACRSRLLLLCTRQSDSIVHVAFYQHHSLLHIYTTSITQHKVLLSYNKSSHCVFAVYFSAILRNVPKHTKHKQQNITHWSVLLKHKRYGHDYNSKYYKHVRDFCVGLCLYNVNLF